MTADLRPAVAPIEAIPPGRDKSLPERQRFFPTRLVLRQPLKRSQDAASGDPATLVWLLTRLWVQHGSLERRIADEATRPRPDADTLGALKRERLAVRDRIAALERSV